MKVLVQDYTIRDLIIMSRGILRTVLSPLKIINFIKIKISRIFKLKKSLGFPINILVEPVRDCNYECPQCPRQTFAEIKKLNKTEITREEFRNIMVKIGKYLLTIRFWHWGEPLMNKELAGMIRIAKEFRIFTVVSSNCSLLERNLGRELIESGLDYLLVSLNAATAQTHKRFTQRDNFEMVVDNLKEFIKIKKSMNLRRPFVNIQFVVMKDNFKEISAIKRISEYIKADKISFKRPGFKHDELGIDNDSYQVTKNKEDLFCCLPYEECIICANGEVIPCVCDMKNDYVMGNVFKENFKSIWNSEKYRNFRKNLYFQEMCHECKKKNNPNFFIKI